jgi:Zn-dependent protease with chaperone function
VPSRGRYFSSFHGNGAIACLGNGLPDNDVAGTVARAKPGNSPEYEGLFTFESSTTRCGTQPGLKKRLHSIVNETRVNETPVKFLRFSFQDFQDYLRLAVCTTIILGFALPARASDTPAPGEANAGDSALTAGCSRSLPAPGSEEKPKNVGKYDVDRIGQRDIGKGINLYSLEKERALGQVMAAAIDRRTKFVADRNVNDYINRLGQKLARNSDAQVAFTIKVIDSPEVKVFSLPGGFLYVDRGLIMEVDSEAELAGMMAHEIAHVAARHASRSATRRYVWNMLSIPLIYLGGPAGFGIKQAAGMGVPLTFKKFDRDAEIEADLLGIEYQYAAGYDPQAFVEVLERLNSKEKQRRARMAKVPVFNFLAKMPLQGGIARAYAGYPSTEDRIQRAQAEISTLLPSRAEYILDTGDFQDVKDRLAWANRPILRRQRSESGTSDRPTLKKPLSDEPPIDPAPFIEQRDTESAAFQPHRYY